MSTFEGLIGFLNQFMNCMAAHLAGREEPAEAGQHGRFSQAETEWNEKVISKRKERVVAGKVKLP